jgi:hypothetical protein
MKPISHYAIVRNTHHFKTSPFDILAVTTMRGRQVYGRSIVDDASTHVAGRDVLVSVGTLDKAKLVLENAAKITAKHKRSISDARIALRDAMRGEQRELDALISAAEKG